MVTMDVVRFAAQATIPIASISRTATTALITALWGLLAELIGLRAAIAAAGILALPTPLLLPRRSPDEASHARKRIADKTFAASERIETA